jgi:hypothetical protein
MAFGFYASVDLIDKKGGSYWIVQMDDCSSAMCPSMIPGKRKYFQELLTIVL